MKVEIRALKEDDAEVSWRWRNDPVVWELTRSRPDRYITVDIEREWIRSVQARKNERRFAICLPPEGKYIGNTYLTDITKSKAQLHIFIGERMFWGKGVAANVNKLMLDYAFNELELKEVYLHVYKANLAAVKACERCGFHRESETGTQFMMVLRASDYSDNCGEDRKFLRCIGAEYQDAHRL